ncbi:MAG: leucine-rich repeat domain-containing protein [Bacteroidetes bacterium]|nr:leucine-rich repeat domain-containing protein [Bacteroidota bacterium]MDA0904052.1 leucine-rich repeat domain-containing protein [Bacteroidota bacterium]MDA1242706.1 leucine-rich repeat domain-containing protein [Bacteroidota bacterium]
MSATSIHLDPRNFPTRSRMGPCVWVVVTLCCWSGSLWGQARREVVQAPMDITWWDDLDMARQAHIEGQDVWAFDGSKLKWKTVPDELQELHDLRYLLMSRNKLEALPPWLSTMKDLRVVIADHNRLTTFPDVLLDMPQLVQVSLGENFIDGIPLDIDRMTKLQFLGLWGNVLARFPASLGDLTQLEVLDLLHNDMTEVEQETLKALLPNVRVVMSPPCMCEFEDPQD